MTEKAAGVFVTVDIVIPRLSPSGTGWEVILIQRKRPPYQCAPAPGTNIQDIYPAEHIITQAEGHFRHALSMDTFSSK